MTKRIADVTVKLPVVVDGVVENIIKFLADLLLHHLYLELKSKRGDDIRSVADAIVGAQTAHAKIISDSASPPTPPTNILSFCHPQSRIPVF